MEYKKKEPFYAPGVKIDSKGRLDVSTFGNIQNTSEIGVKISFTGKIPVRSKKIQWIFSFLGKFTEKLSIVLLRMSLSFFEGAYDTIGNLHEAFQKSLKEKLGYEAQFETGLSTKEIMDFAILCSKELKDKPTYSGIMNKYPHLSQRQAGKIRKVLLERIESIS